MAAGTVQCAVHGKMRAADCMMETPDGFVCREGNECKVTGSGTKQIPCKFFMEGRCSKGPECPFSHDEGMGNAWPAMKGGKGGMMGKMGGKMGMGMGMGMGKMGMGMGKMGMGKMDMWGGGGGFGGWGDAWGGKGMMGMGMGGMGMGMGMCKGKGKGKEDEPRKKCSVHGKMRRISALEEYDGQLSCKEGDECKTVENDGTKRTMCKFHLQGQCAKGEDCAFAHSEEEIGQPVPEGAVPGLARDAREEESQSICSVHGKKRNASQLVDDGSGGMVCKPGCECRDGGSQQRTDALPCRFFQQGKCHRGPDCPFLHGPAGGCGGKGAWGGGCKGCWGGGCKGAGWGCGGCKGGWGGDGWGCGGCCGGWGGDAWGGKMGCKGCKGKGKGDFAWGGCGGGGEPDQAQCAAHGKMRKTTYLVQGADGSWVCKPGSECRQISAGDAGVKPAMCRFFEQGSCQRGDNCAFAHSPDEIGQPLSDSALEALSQPLPGKGEEKVQCALHGKMRIRSSLQESDEPGTFVCRPGCECRGEGQAYGAAQTAGGGRRYAPY